MSVCVWCALSIMPGGYTSRDNIVRVVELHKVGKKQQEIANLTGITRSTVGRIIQRWRKGGSGDAVPEHKHGGGKALKISPKCLRLIKRKLDICPSLTAKELKEKNPKLLNDVSIRAIQENIQKI